MMARKYQSGLAGADVGGGLATRNLTKKYGVRVVVDSVDLTVAAGRILCLVGPSGSGKSTIVNCVAGFTEPDEGSIFIAGRDVTDCALGQRGVTVVFQDYRLFPKMTVRENVSFPLLCDKHAKQAIQRGEVDAAVDRILDAVSMLDRAASFPHELSGGEKQRVSLARALVARPNLLCMDEPLGALDKSLRTELQEEIRRLQRETGVTVLYITHDQQEAMLMADDLAVIDHGQILQVGTPRDLYQRPRSAFVAGFIGECNLFSIRDSTMREDGSTDFVTNAGTIFRARNEATRRGASIGLRPEAIHPHRVADMPTLHGTLIDRSFVGTHERATVRLDSGDVLRLFLAESADTTGVGNAITLSYEPASVLVFD